MQTKFIWLIQHTVTINLLWQWQRTFMLHKVSDYQLFMKQSALCSKFVDLLFRWWVSWLVKRRVFVQIRHWMSSDSNVACCSLRSNQSFVVCVRYIRLPNDLVWRNLWCVINPYPTAFPYGNGMVLHFYQQQESSTTKTVHKVINKGLKAYV